MCVFISIWLFFVQTSLIKTSNNLLVKKPKDFILKINISEFTVSSKLIVFSFLFPDYFINTKIIMKRLKFISNSIESHREKSDFYPTAFPAEHNLHISTEWSTVHPYLHNTSSYDAVKISFLAHLFYKYYIKLFDFL